MACVIDAQELPGAVPDECQKLKPAAGAIPGARPLLAGALQGDKGRRAEESGDDSADSASGTESMDEDWVDYRTPQQRRVEWILLNLANIAWCADNAVLPAVFKELSHSFHVSAAQLSFLVMLKGVTESLFSFPSGFLAEVLPRPALICLGAVIWATGMCGSALAPSFTVLCLCRVVNGVGLGIVSPLLSSLVADTNPPSKRGSAFGSLAFTGGLGGTFVAFAATQVASVVIAGIMGWRFALIAVSCFSATVGVCVALLVGEPRSRAGGALHGRTVSVASIVSSFLENMPKVAQIFRVPTFLIIIAQGSPGTIPWYTFSFMTMWLELNCFSNRDAARINMCFGLGNALAGLLGGKLLDMVFSRHPDHGPPGLAMFSVGVGLPMLAFIIFGLGGHAGGAEGSVLVYSLVFLSFGMLISWCGFINKKVFADVVPQEVFTYVYALDRVVEGTLGAAGSPLVGILTERVFHYDQKAAQAGDCAPESARSLGSGIFSVCFVAWLICFSLYGLMHCTYPTDRVLLAQQKSMAKAKLCCGAARADDEDSEGNPMNEDEDDGNPQLDEPEFIRAPVR